MSILKISLYGSKVLSRPTQRVDKLPEDFAQIVNDMFETMYDDDGIGLSANQVGIDLSFFIADFSLHDESMGQQVFINPEILEGDGSSTLEEGCLSVPEIREEVTRPDRIRVRYRDPDGNSHEEEYQGFPARVIQHESDHLNGIFFVDRVSPLRKSFIAGKLKKIAAQAQKEGTA